MQNNMFKEMIEYDERLLCATRGLAYPPDKSTRRAVEQKYIRILRRIHNSSGIMAKIYNQYRKYLEKKTGINIPPGTKMGKGFIIGHWGRIIINPEVIIGDDFIITQNAVIGRDFRGKRKGAPVIGNRVTIGANAVLVGNIRIGNDVLIAPNSFVNFDVPDHSIVLGNPATIHYRENATADYIGVVSDFNLMK